MINRLLNESNTNDSTCVAYFYCSRNEAEPERADPNEITCSVLKQIFASRRGDSLQKKINEEFAKRKVAAEADGLEPARLTIQESTLFLYNDTDSRPLIIAIDALDECRPGLRYRLFKSLTDLIEESRGDGEDLPVKSGRYGHCAQILILSQHFHHR